MPIAKRYIRKGKCNRCGQCCINENCEHLEIKDGFATCKIFDSPDRPERCKLFPQAPPIFILECGYYFLDTWKDNKIVKYGKDL